MDATFASKGVIFACKLTEYVANGFGKTLSGLEKSKLAENAPKFITEASIVQAASTAASIGLYNLVGRQMIDQDNIKKKAQSGLADIITDCHDNLIKIYSESSLVDLLYDKLNNIMNEYLDRFNSVGAQFATGVPINTASYLLTGTAASYGLGNIIQTGVSLSEDVIKNAQAMSTIVSKTKDAINEIASQAPTSWAVMQKKLTTIFYKGNEASSIIAALTAQKYISNNEINYKDCANLKNINLSEVKLDGTIEGYKKALVDTCNKINELFTQDNFDAFKSNFISLTTGAISFIQKDSARVGSQGFASVVVNLINKGVQKKLTETEESLKKQAERGYTFTNSDYEEIGKSLHNMKIDKTNKEQKPTPTKPRIVAKAESLYKIAAKELGPNASPFEINKLVNKLIELNPELKSNPDLIRDGQVLRMPIVITNNYRSDSSNFERFDKDTCPTLEDRQNWKLEYDWSDITADNKQKPTIELVVRRVFPHTNIMHGFTIFTDSTGQKTIIAGYPEKHNFLLNLEIVDAPYVEANAKLLDKDWASEGDYKNQKNEYKIIKTERPSTDQDLQKYLSKAREAISAIKQKAIRLGNNDGMFDYDLCITDKCWGGNSNTVQRAIWDSMGMKIEVPSDIKMPGIEGKFYIGSMDDVLQNAGDAVQND